MGRGVYSHAFQQQLQSVCSYQTCACGRFPGVLGTQSLSGIHVMWTSRHGTGLFLILLLAAACAPAAQAQLVARTYHVPQSLRSIASFFGFSGTAEEPRAQHFVSPAQRLRANPVPLPRRASGLLTPLRATSEKDADVNVVQETNRRIAALQGICHLPLCCVLGPPLLPWLGGTCGPVQSHAKSCNLIRPHQGRWKIA